MASAQLVNYLRLRFVHGLPRGDAAFEAGLSEGEAALHDADVEAGELQLTEIREGLHGAAADRAPVNPAPAAVALAAVNVTPRGAMDTEPSEARAIGNPNSKERNPAMARGRKKADEEVVEVKQPDFAKAKKIFLNDIKPAEEKNAKTRGDLSAAWKAIQDDCALNKAAAKLLHKLNMMSEETRDDYLRTLYGGMKAFGIGISRDLVDQMNDSDAPEMPVVESNGLGISGLAAGSLQ